MSWAFRFCLEVYFFLLPRAIGPPSELFDKANASRGLIGFDYSHACLEVWPCNGTFRHEYVLTIGSHVAWNRHRTQGVNIPPSFNPRGNCFRWDSDNGETGQQTFACGENRVRRCFRG